MLQMGQHWFLSLLLLLFWLGERTQVWSRHCPARKSLVVPHRPQKNGHSRLPSHTNPNLPFWIFLQLLHFRLYSPFPTLFSVASCFVGPFLLPRMIFLFSCLACISLAFKAHISIFYIYHFWETITQENHSVHDYWAALCGYSEKINLVPSLHAQSSLKRPYDTTCHPNQQCHSLGDFGNGPLDSSLFPILSTLLEAGT